jgi:hypothetical protein
MCVSGLEQDESSDVGSNTSLNSSKYVIYYK